MSLEARASVPSPATGRRERRSEMIHLDLAEAEAATLVKVLDYYVSELRMEITDTEEKDLRDALKTEENVLKKILRTLKERLGEA
jgi:hypothetical protein